MKYLSFNADQMKFKVGDLVRLKGRNSPNRQVGIVTKVTGCYDGFVEVMVGTWKGSINVIMIEAIK